MKVTILAGTSLQENAAVYEVVYQRFLCGLWFYVHRGINMCDFLCSSQGTIIATLQELSKEYIYIYMCLYLQPDSHYWVCSESPGNGYVTSMFYAQCRPRGAIMQNTSSKATYEDEYTNELINERPKMFQNCLCDTGTAISVKIFLSFLLLAVYEEIN